MTCDDFPKESFGITSGAVSGYINDRPTFCGGLAPNHPVYFEWSDEVRGSRFEQVYCYQYYYESKTFNRSDNSVELHTGAFEGAYAQWRNSGIIVAGGSNGTAEEGALNIIQIITESGTKTWKMPNISLGACLVNLHDDTFLLISGLSINLVGTHRSIIITPRNGSIEAEVSEGPLLNEMRHGHACSTLEKSGRRFIVAVGGYSGPFSPQHHCEYLEIFGDNTLDTWKICANLPVPIANGQLLTDPESGDLILLGGTFSDNSGRPTQYYDTIYRLSAIDGEWIEQEKKLDVKRHSHTSMFVPDSQLPCNQTKQKHENIRNEL